MAPCGASAQDAYNPVPKPERTLMTHDPVGPLAGIKIIDLSAVVSGPMAAGILADQGASVIKVEPRQGDLTRIIGPAKGDITGLFAAINRGKRSIVLDLKQDSARAVLRDLLLDADVLIENFRPGALARLGFSYEAVAAFNPRIVYLSISGFGQTGPNAQVRVYDPVIQAAAGFAHAHPHPQTGEPQLLQTLLCDKITALTAAQALTAALLGRERQVNGPGRGQYLALSMLDAAVAFLWPEAFYNHAFLDEPPAPLPELGSNQKLWRCKDGWLALLTPQNEEFAALCRVFDMPALATDPRFASIPARRLHQPQLRELLEPLMALRPVDALATELGAAGVPASRVNLKTELAQDPQVLHNALLYDTAYTGLGRIRTPRAAAQFLGLPFDAARKAPHLGEHSQEIVRELGRSEAQWVALRESGAVG
jgi:crotonobetainyl-CoA:carnitine CoA-transferase CaiB-like acyl-CoA transferase